MTQAWFLGASGSIPQDEDSYRHGSLEYVDDTTPAELESAPDFNEIEVDEVPSYGLTPSAVGGAVTESRQYVNPARALALQDHTEPIDSQVATSGRAPGLEASGIWGHGTMEYTESIQPQIRDGVVLGNEVFTRDARPVQEGMSAAMTPDAIDPAWAAVAQRAGTRGSRTAFAKTLTQSGGWAV